jgi:hypothetical protein
MSTTTFRVEFRGKAPDPLKVGDEVLLSGRATVSKIEGELIDVTAIGSDPKVVLGETTVSLFANKLEVTT